MSNFVGNIRFTEVQQTDFTILKGRHCFWVDDLRFMTVDRSLRFMILKILARTQKTNKKMSAVYMKATRKTSSVLQWLIALLPTMVHMKKFFENPKQKLCVGQPTLAKTYKFVLLCVFNKISTIFYFYVHSIYHVFGSMTKAQALANLGS